MYPKLFHPGTSLRTLARFLRTLIVYGLEYDTIIRSLKTALVIGTLLGVINHGQALVSGHFTWGELAPLLITYLVPFSVTTYGQVQGKRQRDKLWANRQEDQEITLESRRTDAWKSAASPASRRASGVARVGERTGPPTGAVG
ncbi:MAG TPA: nitrate/nitrite transporter NrtS [Ktedonobacteraceae bacterium]|jgi:hypothetical protein